MYLIFAARRVLLYNAHLSTTTKATKASPKIASRELSVKQQTVWTTLNPYHASLVNVSVWFLFFFFSHGSLIVAFFPCYNKHLLRKRQFWRGLIVLPFRPCAHPKKDKKNVCTWVMTSSYRPPVYLLLN